MLLWLHPDRRRRRARASPSWRCAAPRRRKALKRRMELIKERHGDVIAGNAQAQIRKLFAAARKQARRLCLDPDPQARAAAQAAGDDRQGHHARQICDDLPRHRRSSSWLAADDPRRAVHPVAAARPVLRRRRPALRHRQDDQAPDQQVQLQLPRRDRADGPRPSLGPSDHRDARHRRRAKSRARSGSSSAWSPTR